VVTDERELFRRVRRLLCAEVEHFGSSAEGARIHRKEGILASVNPNAPDRSLFNWVVAKSPRELFAGYDELARLYRDAGVRAWGVWLDPDEPLAEASLGERGHTLDGRPRAMAGEIETMLLAPEDGLDWQETTDIATVARLNDAAYGFPPPAFSAAMTRAVGTAWRAYVARHEGVPASCLMTHDSLDGDLGITAVATLPAARGQGLATRLLAAALRAGRARGAKTTTLQASTKGASVYARLGYKDLGAMSVWEHRVSPPR
jgi:GNAT superfamily N-acetyltransferase